MRISGRKEIGGKIKSLAEKRWEESGGDGEGKERKNLGEEVSVKKER